MIVKPLIFNPEITLGHIIQLAGVLTVGMMFYFGTQYRLERLEEHDKQHTDQIVQVQNTQSLLVRAVDRITVLIEEREKRNP